MSMMRGWQPRRTWVVVVGTLEWKHEDVYPAFPTRKRRDEALVRFFESAGVPDSQILFLRDSQATTRKIEERMADHLARSQEGDLLFFYYCGHGYLLDSGDMCLAAYDSG